MRQPAMYALGNHLRARVLTTLRRLSEYRTYCRSVSEMSDLSMRELADLGLHRSEIRQVAQETVYGQRP
jgi:uncharacterized protein YjiS (DUF1127 family)